MTVNSVPASTSLLAEFNNLSPGRSRASDGTIGDERHANSPSDHNPDETGNTGGVEDSDNLNEVHARDVTAAGPWPRGWSMARAVRIIVARCAAGRERRLRYVIYGGTIWSATNTPAWSGRAYNGANKHTHHAHFSFRYGSGPGDQNPENITTEWGLLAALRQEENDVSQEDVIGALRSSEGKSLIRAAVVDALSSDGARKALGDWLHSQQLGRSGQTLSANIASDEDEVIAALNANFAAVQESIAALSARLPE